MSDSRLAEVAVAALHEWDPGELWPLITAELLRGCGGELLIHKTQEWTEESGVLCPWAREGTQEDIRLEPSTERLIRTGHPFIGPSQTPNAHRPVTAARLVGERSWRGGEAAHLLHTSLGTRHVLGLPLPGSARPLRGALVYRPREDFTDAHLDFALRAQPLLSGIHRQSEILSGWHAGLHPAGSGTDLAAAYRLTPRETAVLALLADTLTAPAIARRLRVSVRTVHKHLENIYRKLGTQDRLATVLKAQRSGLLPAARSGRG